MALASMHPFRSRNFALLWSAALVSNVGTWMQAVALGIFVTARTHNPLWTGLVAAAAFLPNGLLAPLGGALADRFDRRRWLLVTTTGETLFATLLTVLAATGRATPMGAVIVAFLGGCAASIGFPAYQAMLPDLVEKDDLLAAVSLSSAQFNLGRVIGPVAAGVALVAGSYAMAFAANALSFLAVLLALVLIRLPRRPLDRTGRSLVREVVAGARTALGEPGCRSAIAFIAVVALLASPFIALVPAMAITVLSPHSGHQGTVATSILVTAQGIGAVAGALTLPGLARRIGRGRLVVGALFLLPVLLVLYGVAPSLPVAALALLLVGGGYIAVLSGLNTVVQLRAPAASRGRVLSFYMFALGTVYPIGAVAQGWLGRMVGVRTVTVVSSLLLLTVLSVMALLRWPLFAALADQPAPGPEASTVSLEAAP